MKCEKCKFIVPTNMRFCLMKNICPSCGGSLFSRDDMNHISLMRNRIGGESFAKNFDEIQIFDLALFIYNEINSGYWRTILDSELKKFRELTSATSDVAVESILGMDEVKASDIRKEVEAEINDKIIESLSSHNETIYEEDDEEDDRVSRLKAQAKDINKHISYSI